MITWRNMCLFWPVVLFMLSCSSDNKWAVAIPMTGQPIVIDGKLDEQWQELQPFSISDLWWGEPPIDVSDLKAEFKILQDATHIYLLVDVLDDKRYTHPVPTHPLDKKFWRSDDYDKVNIILRAGSERYEVGLNYHTNEIFGEGVQCAIAKFDEFDSADHYGFEIALDRKLIGDEDVVHLDVSVFDNDMKYNKAGLDVFSERETMIGFSCEYSVSIP